MKDRRRTGGGPGEGPGGRRTAGGPDEGPEEDWVKDQMEGSVKLEAASHVTQQQTW